MVSEIKRRRWSGDSVEENSKNCLDKHMGTRRPELRRINNLESLTHQLYRENSGRRKVRRKPSKKKKPSGKEKKLQRQKPRAPPARRGLHTQDRKENKCHQSSESWNPTTLEIKGHRGSSLWPWRKGTRAEEGIRNLHGIQETGEQ